MHRTSAWALVFGLAFPTAAAAGHRGYYRQPTTDGQIVVFVAEGDLWRVPIEGGRARHLTSHQGRETDPVLSPDGTRVAFAADYEGAAELYVMPVDGGLPTRLTWNGEASRPVSWTPDGRILYSTRAHATLPNGQLVAIDPDTLATTRVPLAQASQGVYDETGHTLFFTRFDFQGSSTKRYVGGTAQDLWKYDGGGSAAVALTPDYPGTSRDAMWGRGRVWFASDRDGTMNIWSIAPDGTGARQHTRHEGWDAQSPDLGGDSIVYQNGADLWRLDLASDKTGIIEVELTSDFGQTRPRWVHDPMTYMTAVHLSPDGDRVALTARGQVFVAPVNDGRLVEASRDPGVRYRAARFMAQKDADPTLVALSDRTGELEFWRVPADGLGRPKQMSNDGRRFRFDGHPSPDGRWLAYTDKDHKLSVFDVQTRATRLVVQGTETGASGLAWSHDSRWLAYVDVGPNSYSRIWLFDTKDGAKHVVTSDRVNSGSPAWSRDGKLLYFVSERHLRSIVGSPWGPRAPEPFIESPDRLYGLLLKKDTPNPFEMPDEVRQAAEKKKEKDKTKKKGKAKDKKQDEKKPAGPAKVEIDFDGLATRLVPVPVPPGNYGGLEAAEKHLYWTSSAPALERKTHLEAIEIDWKEPKVVRVVSEIEGFELSADGKKMLIVKKKANDGLFVVDADGKEQKKLGEKRADRVALGGWRFAFDPREEWRQMFVEAWRLERDYFYDRNMHGVNWRAMLEKYVPLVERVTDRDELSDLIHQMVGELEALHIFVRRGDRPGHGDEVHPAQLGARWTRDDGAGGYRIDHVFQADPDYPEELSPLHKPGVDVVAGSVVTHIDGVGVLSVPHPASLLRDRAGRKVRLGVKPAAGNVRDVIVEPLTVAAAESLRYADWEHSRRLRVEADSDGQIGYVHLRNFGGGEYTSWARDFYPVFDRAGLIVDVRHNRGGNIDSWILARLMRKAWMYWSQPVGSPVWNMQYAFRGHVVVLVDEFTMSDGEAFAEGFRRLGLGKVIGTRTWGGEIWLSFDNWLVDKGIASAAEYGVYGPEGIWLIEGHGVEPDIVVDNEPHATFGGADAQLDAAVRHLEALIAESPTPVPQPPPYPIKPRPAR